MSHRKGAIVESEYNTELFNVCFDFDKAHLTAVATLVEVRIAWSLRRGRDEGSTGGTLLLEDRKMVEKISSSTDTRNMKLFGGFAEKGHFVEQLRSQHLSVYLQF